ncbi:MAG TPA: hypothetical protein VJH75_01720 [Patescibacteria group bacterium]|nr:hypothetical protein [Patescibacteria group bacterium]
MLNRIDKAVIPAGLIRSAKTYSLVLDDTGLYIIRTGPAGRHVQARGGINMAIVDLVRDSQAQKVAEGEKRLTSVSLVELVKEKGNVFIPRGEIRGATVGKNIYEEITLEIDTVNKKWKFHFLFVEQEGSVKQFAELLGIK